MIIKPVKGVALIAAALLGIGCGSGSSSTVDHTLVSNASEEVPPGACVPVEGPYSLPDGADMAFSIADVDDTDDMDVGVIDDSLGCDFSSGYGVVLDAASVNSSADNLPVGSYDLIVNCRNVVTSCIFSVSWSASY